MTVRREPPIAGAYIPEDGSPIVCLERCWPCRLGDHFEPAEWHTWADDEDVEHARSTQQRDPSDQRCGCSCSAVAA